MTDEAELAPKGAGSEVVTKEAEQGQESEATENTEGQLEEAPAEAEAKPEDEAKAEEDRKTRSQRRREAKMRMQQELQDAQARAESAEMELKRVRKEAADIARPKESDFNTFEEYQAALSAFAAMQAMDKRRVQELEATAKGHFAAIDDMRKQHQQEEARQWAAQVEEGRAKYSDFDVVALQKAPIATELGAMAIRQSDYAPDIAYALGKDPALGREFAEIEAAQDGYNLARFIGRMEAMLTAPKPKTATSAPDPIKPVRPSANPQKRIEDMTPAEYDKWRASGGTFTL